MIESLIDSCLGLSPLDILISGRIVDVYNGNVFDGFIGVKDGLIVYVGQRTKSAKKIMDFPSKYILPAYIDGHIHIESSLMTPSVFARAVIPHGTCCVIADPHEIANVMGLDGIKFMIEDAERTPMKFYFMIPSSVPSTNLETAGAEIGLKEIEILKGFRQILGLGEVMNYRGVINKNKGILDKIKICRGMIVDGHAPGLRGDELCAYILAGIGSDHEATSLEEAKEKLMFGMWIMIREGTTAKAISNLIKVVSRGCPERVMLVTDDRHASDIMHEGHLDHCLRRAVKEGLDPIDAVRMVTIKPAEYFRLQNLGSLSPGKSADIVVVNDLREFKAEIVLIDGKLVAKDGKYLGARAEAEKQKPFALPKGLVNIGELTLRDLCIKHPHKKYGKTMVRVIGLVENQIITEEIHQELNIVDGKVEVDLDRDVLKICVVERHKGTGRVGKGFVTGFGLKSGALASTFAHDSHNVIVVGVDDRDIYKAIWRLKEINGGFVIVDNETILGELPLPVAGLMTTLSADEISRRIQMLEEIAIELGCKVKAPFTALSFLSLPVVPKLKITDLGLIDGEKLKKVNLFID